MCKRIHSAVKGTDNKPFAQVRAYLIGARCAEWSSTGAREEEASMCGEIGPWMCAVDTGLGSFRARTESRGGLLTRSPVMLDASRSRLDSRVIARGGQSSGESCQRVNVLGFVILQEGVARAGPLPIVCPIFARGGFCGFVHPVAAGSPPAASMPRDSPRPRPGFVLAHVAAMVNTLHCT